MKLDSLYDLLLEEMQDLLDAEQQLVKTLPKLAKASSNAELSQAFTDHLEETKGHVERLKQAFEELGEKPKRKTCDGMKGLLKEGEHFLKKDKNVTQEVRDAGLIASAQRVEHYEMAGYGCVVKYAEQLGERAVAALLERTLNEEKAADELLSEIAESDVNAAAIA